MQLVADVVANEPQLVKPPSWQLIGDSIRRPALLGHLAVPAKELAEQPGEAHLSEIVVGLPVPQPVTMDAGDLMNVRKRAPKGLWCSIPRTWCGARARVARTAPTRHAVEQIGGTDGLVGDLLEAAHGDPRPHEARSLPPCSGLRCRSARRRAMPGAHRQCRGARPPPALRRCTNGARRPAGGAAVPAPLPRRRAAARRNWSGQNPTPAQPVDSPTRIPTNASQSAPSRRSPASCGRRQCCHQRRVGRRRRRRRPPPVEQPHPYGVGDEPTIARRRHVAYREGCLEARRGGDRSGGQRRRDPREPNARARPTPGPATAAGRRRRRGHHLVRPRLPPPGAGPSCQPTSVIAPVASDQCSRCTGRNPSSRTPTTPGLVTGRGSGALADEQETAAFTGVGSRCVGDGQPKPQNTSWTNRQPR